MVYDVRFGLRFLLPCWCGCSHDNCDGLSYYQPLFRVLAFPFSLPFSFLPSLPIPFLFSSVIPIFHALLFLPVLLLFNFGVAKGVMERGQYI